MQAAIDCLTRELNMLEQNYEVTEQELANGEPTSFVDPEEQQAFREVQIEGIREGLDYLNF